MDKRINLLPRLSEKSYGLSQKRVYVIDVDKSANKLSIKKAVEDTFDVKVISVNLTNIIGKTKRSSSKNGRRLAKGKDKDIKKAYVTLKESYTLPFFDAIEEEEKQSEKVQAEIEKQQQKEEKKTKKLSVRRNKVSKEEK